MKKYQSDKEGKKAFVDGPLSDLVYQANTGWGGCVYEVTENGEEYVCLLNYDRIACTKICVSADSCEAIVRNVFKNL